MASVDLTELQVLVQRLSEGLKKGSDDDAGKNLYSLASRYAEYCVLANERLRTCATILSQGSANNNKYQALIAATSPPDLLDLLKTLSFLPLDEWTLFCRRNHLPEPEPINEQFKQMIDPLFAETKNFQQKLRGEFNAAQSKPDFRSALNIGRQILRLDPADKAMVSQVSDLETRCVGEVLKKLKLPMEQRDVHGVMSLLADIDEIAPGRKPLPKETLLIEALEIRKGIRREEAMRLSEDLIAEAIEAREKHQANQVLVEELKAKDAVGELDDQGKAFLRHLLEKPEAMKQELQNLLSVVLQNISEVNSLQTEHEFILKPEDRDSQQLLSEWSSHQVKLLKIEDERQAKIRKLETLLKEIEDKEFSDDKPKLREHRSDEHALQRQWKDIADYGKAVDQELQLKAEKLLGEIQQHIALGGKKQRIVLVSSLVTGVMILTGCVVFAVCLFKANQEAAILERSIADKRAKDLEKRITALEAAPPIWISLGELPGTIEKGNSWIAKEKSVAARVNEAIGAIEGELGAKPEASQWNNVELLSLKNRRAQAVTDSGEVVPDYQQEMHDRLARIERGWQQIVDKIRPTITQDFHEKVGALELTIREDLNLDRTPGEIGRSIGKTGKLIGELERFVKVELEELQPLPSDVTKFGVLKEKFTEVEKIFEKSNVVLAECRGAQDLPDYLQAIAKIGDTNMLEGSQLAALQKMIQESRSLEHVATKVIAGGDLALWTRINTAKWTGTGTPPSLTGKEKAIILGLRDEEKLTNLYVYDREQGKKKLLVYSIGEMDSKESRTGDVTRIRAQGGKTYDPGRDGSSEAVFKEQQYEMSRFAAGSSGTAPLNGKRTPESEFLRKLRIESFVSANLSSYNKSLLEFIEQLIPGKIDPVFKAYLHQQIAMAIQENRDPWLVEFTDFDKDCRELDRIVGINLGPTDWCHPEKIREKAGELAVFYGKLEGRKYAKPAMAVSATYKRLVTGGMKYGGFVSLDGKPELIAQDSASELWGCDTSFQITRLFLRDKDEWVALAEPSPLCPLFSFPVPPGEVLRRVGEEFNIDITLPEIRSRLPDLFGSTTQNVADV